MKVLVATYYTGHVSPAQPVVEELLRRGHEVVWLTGPAFRDKVLRTGARFAPMSGDALVDDDCIHTTDGLGTLPNLAKTADHLQRLCFARIPAQVNDYRRVVLGTEAAEAAGVPRIYTAPDIDNTDAKHATPDPVVLAPFEADVLVVDVCTFAARCYKDLTGTPYATIGIHPLVTLDPEIPPWGTGQQPPTTPFGLLHNQLRHWLGIVFSMARISREYNKVRRVLGLAPRSRWRSYADDVRSPDLHIQMTTPAFEFPRKNQLPSVAFVGPLLPTWHATEVDVDMDVDMDVDEDEDWPTPDWWDEMLNHPRERVVHIAQGTRSTDTALLVRPTVEALADRDDLLLIMTGQNVDDMFADAIKDGKDGKDDARLTRLARPANVRTAAFVPHMRLLPHVGVMVTNAGYNVTLTALSCGVPLVCAGRSDDRADVSSRVAWSGAGIDLGTAAPSAAAVRAAVLRIVGAGLAPNRRNSIATVLSENPDLQAAMAAIDTIHGPEHNYRAAARRIRDDFAAHNPPAEAADALERLVVRKTLGAHRALSDRHRRPQRSSLKTPLLGP